MTEITELWNGRTALADSCGTQVPEVKHIVCLSERSREELYKELSPRQKEIFEKYVDCQQEYLLRLTESAFCRGFSFASRLWGEAVFGDG